MKSLGRRGVQEDLGKLLGPELGLRDWWECLPPLMREAKELKRPTGEGMKMNSAFL